MKTIFKKISIIIIVIQFSHYRDTRSNTHICTHIRTQHISHIEWKKLNHIHKTELNQNACNFWFQLIAQHMSSIQR